MSRYNPYFWEVQTDTAMLEQVPAAQGLYHQTEVDRERRYAMSEFYQEVRPAVFGLIDLKLTKRQREVVTLYYVHDKTQEDIAAILELTQSTVSRHLFGTVRAGKRVGGAIPKLKKAIDRTNDPTINFALGRLKERMALAV
jgi:FixJ family two-component response regulator